jgi:hypothetical protein
MPQWTDQTTAVANVGAVEWCDALTNSCANLLVNPNDALQMLLTGHSAHDFIGTSGVIALSSGSYVVGSDDWNDAVHAVGNVGAATWCSALGCAGPVTAAGSLVGTSNPDSVGHDLLAFANGNYLVASPNWTGGTGNTGAVTLEYGIHNYSTYSAVVSASNSLVGSSAVDYVGSQTAILSDGNYVIVTDRFAGGAGAVTLASGQFRLVGQIAPWNSVIQQSTAGGINYAYDASRHELVVGRPGDNLVSLFTMDQIFFDNLEN